MTKKKVYDKQFKMDAVKYVEEHPNLTIQQCSTNLNVPISNLNRWRGQFKNNNGVINNAFRGSGNHASDSEKEAARLRKENKDLKDALEVLKKAIGILGD